jgi:hypothetical protein
MPDRKHLRRILSLPASAFAMRAEIKFDNAPNVFRAVQTSLQKYFRLPLTQITSVFSAIPSRERGVS